jgi:WhiB family redox-sensing transcriptional regulator
MRDLPVNKNISYNISWMDKASCKGLTHIFFGKYAERPQATARREARAKSICSQCPVFKQCRQYARDNMELGYWAGENEYDRYLSAPPEKIPSVHSRALKSYSNRLKSIKKDKNEQVTQTHQDASE